MGIVDRKVQEGLADLEVNGTEGYIKPSSLSLVPHLSPSKDLFSL